MKWAAAAWTAALLGISAAEARDYSRDLVCVVRDTAGQMNVYAFTNNTQRSLVETGYGNGKKFVASPVGSRPVWHYTDGEDFAMLTSQDSPEWSLVIKTDDGAYLVRKGVVVGRGECRAPRSAHVGTTEDRGQE